MVTVYSCIPLAGRFQQVFSYLRQISDTVHVILSGQRSKLTCSLSYDHFIKNFKVTLH